MEIINRGLGDIPSLEPALSTDIVDEDNQSEPTSSVKVDNVESHINVHEKTVPYITRSGRRVKARQKLDM